MTTADSRPEKFAPFHGFDRESGDDEAPRRHGAAAMSGHRTPALHAVVAGGGLAGAEAVLAIRALAGENVSITLLAGSDELVVPATAVGEPFALGHAARLSLSEITDRAGARLRRGRLARVDDDLRRVVLEDGSEISYDALLLAVGARPVARVEHATTWWPRGDPEIFGGLLRDLEEGYTRSVAFVIPPGAVWPLPLYELAMMTAREVDSVGIYGVQLTVVTPEAQPLAYFGSTASHHLRDELREAGIRLETASLVRFDRSRGRGLILQPSGRRLNVERTVALPAMEGPAIPGTHQNESGFIQVDSRGQMAGSTSVWAVGDAIAYPVKYGGLAAQQADVAAAEIAVRAGAEVEDEQLHTGAALSGALMTGATPRLLGQPMALAGGEKHVPLLALKTSARYLTPVLWEHDC